MKYFSPKFSQADRASDRRDRLIVNIVFDVGSLYFTSHDDITGVPGTVLNGVVRDVSAVSQRIVPDEGRSEIGSMSFSLVDRNSTVTNEFRSKLNSAKGLRGKTVRLYRGFEGFTWSEFSLFQTQVIRDAEFDFGAYSIQCSDITREQRKEIFQPVSTGLRLSCSETDTTIAVYDTAKFLGVEHGASYSDAPGQTVVYFKIQDETIRCPVSGIGPDTFTGCQRGALNTRPRAHAVDATTAADQRTKVEEVVYLELPAGMLAFALLTGVLHGQSGTLPAHWHLGIDPSLVKLSDFTGIGPDLWKTSDHTQALILRFAGEKAQDGKAFLEKKVLQPMGCFSPVYADGTLGLRRMAALTSDAAAVATLTEDHFVSHSGLQHQMSRMINVFQIDWSYEGKEPRRQSRFTDLASQAVHGKAPLKKLEWPGIYGSRHTDITIWQRLYALRDRYSAPPLGLDGSLVPSLASLEVGDVVRVKVANLRNYTGAGDFIDQAMEIQQISINHTTGDLDVDLFGSTARPSTTPPADLSSFPLPDGFYSAAGTLLSAIAGVTVAGNVLTVAPGTPYNGGADLTASQAIVYWLGDLTIPNGVTLRIAGNVWLRVMGDLVINGTIDGNYGGLPGVADDGALTPYLLGNPGFIGNSRGLDGLRVTEMGGNPQLESQPIPTTEGRFAAFPFLTLQISGNNLLGVPTDLRGSGGGPGGKVVYQSTLLKNGGTGGAGGAGLCITARRIDIGASGQVTLRGADTAAPTPHLEQGKNFYPGTGGAGAPGSLLLLLDAGPFVTAPDLTGKFYGVSGAVAQPYYSPEFPVFFMPSRAHQRRSRSEQPYAGYLGPEIISAQDLSNACHRIQYIPPVVLPVEDVDDPPPPPIAVTAIPGPGYNLVTIFPAEISGATVELYESLDGNVANATFLQDLAGTQFYHALLGEETRYYHARSKLELDANTVLTSDWFAGTVVSTAGTAIAADLPEERDFLDTYEHQDALGKYDSVYGSGTLTYPTDGSYGGHVLQVAGGSRSLIWKQNIPLDPTALYRMSVRVRQTMASTNSTKDGVWVGFRAIGADGVTPIQLGDPGDHYVAAANFDMGSVPLGTWATLIGYFSSQTNIKLSPAPDIDNPSGVSFGTAYLRPIVFANYFDGDGTQQFDYVRIEKLIDGRWQDIDGEGKPSDYADNTFSQNPGATGVFYDNFEHQDIWRFYTSKSAAVAGVSYPLDGIDGGRVLQVQGDLWAEWKENIPLDPNAIYRLTGRVRRTVAGAAGAERLVVGYQGIAADGVSYINTLGANLDAAQHWQIYFFDMGTIGVGTWTDFVCWASGNGTPVVLGNGSPGAPMKFYPGVKYFRPTFWVNNPDGTGTVQVDRIRIERLIPLATGLIANGAVFEPFSATTASSDVYNSGSTSTQVVQVTVPAQDVPTTQVVTVVGNVDHNAASGTQGSTFALITDAFSSGQSYATEDTIARNPSTSLLRQIQTFSLERSYSVAAGVAKTFSLSALGMGFSAAGSSCLLKSVRILVKVFKA
ncbi:MAG TPA: hypothetical protein PLX85_00235 [Dehalococcoidia bacterium]|nr:hypothetical protein [Dehalococcoidia bacterium]